ncbi:MAG: NigD-like C-terminal domain-containing protein [Bacteroidia bacterium]|nr:NigD-like C-terminal domain-containing protein [Bacteroidia bacterium]
MKKIFYLLALAAALTSCLGKEKEEYPDLKYYRATVTFRPMENGSYYLKQDEQTALVVLNSDLKDYPFEDGKERRAYVEYSVDDDSQTGSRIDGFATTKEVSLIYADTIYTKDPVFAEYDDIEDYGDDPVGLYTTNEFWPSTCIEDGYLSISFAMPVGFGGVTHTVDLLLGTDPDDPYKVRFMHDALNDSRFETQDCLVNFPLKDLPDTNGETVDLTLVWNSLVSGEEESVKIKYCSRKDW